VEELEQKYPKFAGLNLTWEVREGLAKHETRYDLPGEFAQSVGRCASLEAQVANLADEITYYSHDLDDGLDSGLLSEDALDRHVRIWRQAARTVRRQYGELPDECRWYFTIRCIIDGEVRDVVRTTERRLRQARPGSADAVRRLEAPQVQYSSSRLELNGELGRYLHRNVYENHVVHEPNKRAVRMMEQLFAHYLERPQTMGATSRRRIRRVGLHRAVCDYIAGMTDRYVMAEHRRLFGVDL
jgi:dGTPase